MYALQRQPHIMVTNISMIFPGKHVFFQIYLKFPAWAFILYSSWPGITRKKLRLQTYSLCNMYTMGSKVEVQKFAGHK